MRSLLLAAAILAIPSSAFAMGVYVDIHVVAWNRDGTAALFARNTSSSGTTGKTEEYVLVGAGDAAPLAVSFDDTQDPDQPSQKIDRTTCARDAARLDKALAARHFQGVKVRADHCKSDRAVVTITAAETRRVTASKVGDLSARPPADDRERGITDAIKHALGAVPEGDVDSATGKLIVVASGAADDADNRRQVAVIEVAAGGAKVLVENLRP